MVNNMYYSRPSTHYTTVYWTLLKTYGLTTEEANKCIYETMGWALPCNIA